MNDIPKIIHLLSDISLGGVTKNLELFKLQKLANRFNSQIVGIKPEWNIAPTFGADIIITHFSPSWRNLPFLYSLLKNNTGAKILHMEHSYSPEWEEYSVPNPSRFRAMLKLSYAFFDHIICVSKTQKKWLETISVAKSDKLHVINPWSDMDALWNLSRPIFSNPKTMTLGCYGRLVKEKGFEDLLQSFQAMKNQSQLRLLIGGYGPDDFSLQKLAANNPKIKFYGKVENVSHFIKHCDIIAVPSYFETFGLVATEARAAGRPIVVSPVGSLIEQMGNAGQVINFKNHNHAANILDKIREFPLDDMSLSGRESCKNLTSNQISQWIQFLGNLIYGETFFGKAA